LIACGWFSYTHTAYTQNAKILAESINYTLWLKLKLPVNLILLMSTVPFPLDISIRKMIARPGKDKK